VAGYIRRCLTQDKDCVIVTVDTREILQTLMEQQEAYPSPMLHLARACVASLLVQGLNASIENESIELQWKLQGAFGDLNARSEGFGKVRGNIQKTKVFFPELDHSLGEGIFQCRKTKNQISSQGILPSQGQVYLDLQEYFENSEQKKCALGMSVNFKLDSSANSERPYVLDRAQGYLLHILPGSNGSDEILTRKMHHHLEALGPISEWALEDNAEAATLIPSKLFTGFKKSCHPHYKFDSKTEKDLGIILEDDKKSVLKWLRPAQGQLYIYWKHNSRRYHPDFIVETKQTIFMIETKKETDIESTDVQEKALAALNYCKAASKYTKSIGGKDWKYVLIPHNVVMQNMSFDNLVKSYEFLVTG
jgi:redox-regulated HSP33 family molecular chaperone